MINNCGYIIFFKILILTSCKSWDPNTQFANEMAINQSFDFSSKNMNSKQDLYTLEIGQSLAEITKNLGYDYKILAKLNTNNANWVMIEYRYDHQRVELKLKNNKLIDISY